MSERRVLINIFIFGFAATCGIVYLSYQFERWFNYKFGYEAKVKAEIHEMVKSECLK